jgi:hypothetical protein
MVKKTKELKCSICKGPIPVEHGTWKYGHNAEPVNSGRCCGNCNTMVVIPMRLLRFAQNRVVSK